MKNYKEIETKVSEYMNTPLEDIYSKSRKQNIVISKMLITNLAINLLKMTINELAKIFKVNHSTTHYYKEKLDYDKLLQNKYNEIIK